MAKLVFLFLAVALMVSCPSHAETTLPNNYQEWLQQLEMEAISSGISSETVHAALDHAELDDSVIELDKKQPEKTVTFEHYVHNIVSPSRVQKGKRLLDENETELDDVSNRYGVPPQIIVALWGIESSFGNNMGEYKIVDSLLTLAYEGRRAEFFRKELINALRILDEEHIASSSLRGSWAGAMGQCQFMPSTYLHYAADGNHDGRRDIWDNEHDVFASIANYLAAEGWDANLTWGREVELEQDIAADDVGLDHKYLLCEWAAKGVRNVDGAELPAKPLQASLIQPDGPDGRSFLVYDNFRALMLWNRSTYFATSVGLLADRMK